MAKAAVWATTRSGAVCFNDVVLQGSIPQLPFGGVGESGMGAYHGRAGFLRLSHPRSVLQRPQAFDAPWRYPPYGNRLRWLQAAVSISWEGSPSISLLDCYRVLQVPRHADRATLRRAFLRLCKRHHPDTTTLPRGGGQ